MTSSYLKSVKLVTYDGVKEIDDTSNPMVMKVFRGVGHNMGVLTEVTFDFSSVRKGKWHYVFYDGIFDAAKLKNILKTYDEKIKDKQYFLSKIMI